MAKVMQQVTDLYQDMNLTRETLADLPLNDLPPEECELLMVILYKSKIPHLSNNLYGSGVNDTSGVGRRLLTQKYNNMEKRLSLILGEIDAGNNNLDMKEEAKKIGSFLKTVHRLTAVEYDAMLRHIKDPE